MLHSFDVCNCANLWRVLLAWRIQWKRWWRPIRYPRGPSRFLHDGRLWNNWGEITFIRRRWPSHSRWSRPTSNRRRHRRRRTNDINKRRYPTCRAKQWPAKRRWWPWPACPMKWVSPLGPFKDRCARPDSHSDGDESNANKKRNPYPCSWSSNKDNKDGWNKRKRNITI